MKRFHPLLALVLGFSLLAACSDDPVETGDGDGGTSSPYSGIFLMESALSSSSCAVPSPPSTMMTVVIEGDSIWFGGFPGVWDESTLTGTGDTPEYTVPVSPPECYAYYKVVYEITYVTADSFSGTYGANYRKDQECPDPDPCSFLYDITGSR